jgi:hypothetical protein
MRLLPTLALAAGLAAVAPEPGLAGPAIDELAARLRSASEDTSLPARQRSACARAVRTLGAPDAPGPTDDFRRLAAVGREAAAPLAGDTSLAAAFSAAIGEADAALGDVVARVLGLVSVLDPGRDRRAAERANATAARWRQRFDATHDPVLAARVGLRTSRAYDAALRNASRAVARQDRRPARWSVALEGLGGALLSVWTDGALDPQVYAVGARDGADGPLFLRLGGDAWVRIPVLPDGDLWWVTNVPADGVWACGSGGRVVRYDAATGAIDARPVPGVTSVLYGIWGSGPDDVWTVGGGDASGGGPEAELHHWDGVQWTEVAVPEAVRSKVLYKVWGRAADDVWVCGSGGTLLRFDGQNWSQVATGTVTSLLTVHGTPDAGGVVAAVGGPGTDATIVEIPSGGAASVVHLAPGLESLNGIAFDASGEAWAAGVFGQVMRRRAGTWSEVDDVPTPRQLDHHAVASDGRGGAWFAGGSLTGTLDDGFLLRFGTRVAPTTIVRRATLRADVAPALVGTCGSIGCHLAPFANEDLDLSSAEALRTNTVGVPSAQSPLPRVLAGRPAQSYLWHKLVGTQAAAGGRGDRMPGTGVGLPQADLDAVRAWILEGALDD